MDLILLLTSVLARKWLSSWINENILFTKSAITSECHNIFGWNKKYYFNEWVGQTMSLSILIFWESLWPKFYPILPQNWAQNALFPLFSELFLVFLLKHSSKQYRLSKWVMHSLKLPVKKKNFCRVGLPGGPEKAQISPKILLKLQFWQNCSFNKIYTK